jgi:hypothetical protein
MGECRRTELLGVAPLDHHALLHDGLAPRNVKRPCLAVHTRLSDHKEPLALRRSLDRASTTLKCGKALESKGTRQCSLYIARMYCTSIGPTMPSMPAAKSSSRREFAADALEVGVLRAVQTPPCCCLGRGYQERQQEERRRFCCPSLTPAPAVARGFWTTSLRCAASSRSSWNWLL